MTGTTVDSTGVQLDRSTRSVVERAVLSMRSTAEADLRYQLTDRYGLDDPETVPEGLTEEDRERRSALREAIEREAVDGHDWPEAVERYIQGTGYTVVNRLAALRCMEARGFLDRPVTQFREDGRTPAADPLMDEEFLPRDEALLEAYRRACDGLAEEVELLFDRDSAYSQLEPRPRTFEELCRTLDEVPEAAWRADDVLGWVYQYYHIEELDELRSKAGREGLDPEDVAPANQFYTPHWVVRMLTDNSLGKLYLERVDGLEAAVEAQEPLSPEERKHRSLDPEETPTVADLCTYLVPGSEAGGSTEWSDPSELRVIDPACGSGHFLLYAFDVLERIWWAERPDIPRQEVPSKILRHNLYGVDIDLRACQLAAFNLYLKARSRAETEGTESFELPPLNIVCADARVAELEEAEAVFAEVTEENSREREALETILETFRGSYGLGSLLDVKGTLQEELAEQHQQELFEEWAGPEELLHELVQAVERRRGDGSFLVRDLKSFLRLLEVLADDYDVALMNPPYGSSSGGRMPDSVRDYVENHYQYPPQYYINFFEASERLIRAKGRVAMLVPRTFMYKKTYQSFREDFVGERGAFDFLAEYGIGILDNATVRTVGTVVREEKQQTDEDRRGLFLRLHDKETEEKELAFANAICGEEIDSQGVQRVFRCKLSDFGQFPGTPLSYWVPSQVRRLYDSSIVFDANNARLERKSLGSANVGLQTGNDDRFYRYFWEVGDAYDRWKPLAKGGEDAFILPRIVHVVLWENKGEELKRYSGSYVRNEHRYFRAGLTWTTLKETGRRFGLLHPDSIFSHAGYCFFPHETSVWPILAYTNSSVFHYLMLGLTLYRGWMVGKVSAIPWFESLEEDEELIATAKKLFDEVKQVRRSDPQSPYYTGPSFLQRRSTNGQTFFEHPHSDDLEEDEDGAELLSDVSQSTSLSEIREGLFEGYSRRETRIVETSERLDDLVFSHFGIDGPEERVIRQEIVLRSKGEEGQHEQSLAETDGKVLDVSDVAQHLLHYLGMKCLREDEDGVVPLLKLGVEEEPGFFERLVESFTEIWGDHAPDRLLEVDQGLGDRAPTGGDSYPNLRAWLKEDLFSYHTSTFKNTPFLWRLTTERLVPDAKGEGFGCVIDYHQLTASTFDTLHQRYLQPRRAALRERRDAADQRRRDQSLAAAERGEAEEEFQRCRSGIEQIGALEDALRELARPQPRDWTVEDRALAEGLRPRVARFRERLGERLETLDQLWETAADAWLEETFSPTFREKVEENRREWVDALEDLETACEAYAKPAGEPVEAHLYDLFVYYQDDLIGSTHHGSNGIFFLNYYFSKGGQYLTEEGEPRSGLQDSERLLAELARKTDADVELGREIAEGCAELADRIPSDWEERALAEVTTAGYRPVKKHGVRINITPLAEAGLVPELVEKKVL